MCNETYMDNGNDKLDFSSPYDRLIWCRTNNTELSLTIYKELCLMFVRFLKQRTLKYKFFFPLSSDFGIKGAGHFLWDDFFRKNLDEMGVDGVIFHSYAKGIPPSSDLPSIYKYVMNWETNYYNFLKNTAIPLLPGKLISISEWSSTENFPTLRGTEYGTSLYKYVIGMQQSIPQIVSSHYHAFANGQPGYGIKAAGWMKQSQVQIQPIGKAYMGIV